MVSHQLISPFPFHFSQRLVWFGLFALIIILVNPLASLDLAALALFLLVLGHVLLREKLLLVFLLIRPTLDYWRDLPLFTYRDTTLNVTDTSAIFFLLWSIWLLFSYRREIKRAPLFITLLSLIALMGISSLWSIAPFTTLIETVKFINLALLFWLSYFFVKHQRLTLPVLALTIAASTVIPILFAVGQLITSAGLATFDLRGRLYGTLGHPNVFAFLMLSLIILLTQWSVIEPIQFWQKRPKLRVTCYVLCVTLLLLTYTRVTLIGLAIFLFMIGITKYHRLLAGLAIGVSIFYLIFFPLNDWLIARANYSLTSIPVIGRLTARNEDADSIGWRLSLIRETIPIIHARPLLGYGFGTFKAVWGENRSAAHFWDDSAEAHNDYLRLTLELGFVGLFLYIILLFGLVALAGKKLQKNNNKFYLILFNLFKFRLTGNDTKYLHVFSWILIFAVTSLSDNLLHHTPVMWLTFAYWGAALATPRAPGSLLI